MLISKEYDILVLKTLMFKDDILVVKDDISVKDYLFVLKTTYDC